MWQKMSNFVRLGVGKRPDMYGHDKRASDKLILVA